MVDGRPQEEGPRLRSFPRQRPDDDEDDELYVLVEPASTSGETYCDQLVDAIGRTYRQDPLSLTGAVLRSLKAAHRQLIDWNERSLPEHRVTAGINCLAVRGRQAYLVQLGPAIAYHVGSGTFRRLAPQDGAALPLGQPELAEPLFSQYQLSPGDLLLLASPMIEDLFDEEALRSILLRGADQALLELFRLARDQQQFSLVLLACVVEPETATERRSPLPLVPEEPANNGETPASGPGVPVAAGQAASVGTAFPSHAPPAPAAPGEAELSPAAGDIAAAAEPPTAGTEFAGEASFAGEPPLATETTGAADPFAGSAAELREKVRLKGSDADIRYPRSTGLGASLPRIPPFAFIGLALLIVAVLLAWWAIPAALDESQTDRYDARVAEATEAIRQVGEIDDPARQRTLLRNAEEALVEADGIRSGSAEVNQLRNQVAFALTALNAVLVLPEPELIVDVSSEVPGAVSAGDLALGGGGIYFIDREQHRVIAIALLVPEPEPFVMVESGAPVGTEFVGQPQHIAWAEDLGALLVLDDARRLFSIVPGQAPSLLTVRDAQSWDSADGIAHAAGSLYVLDRVGDQVWRYLPSESGFDSEPEPLVTGSELEQATEIAVSNAVYVIMEDGAIHRFTGNAEQSLSFAGIDRPLVSPASLTPLPDSKRLLVADLGNKRLVALTEDGAFQQQFVSPTFTDLRAITVDEVGGLAYILVGSALYRTPLPPPP